MITVVVGKLSRRPVPDELWALCNDLGSRGLVDWSRAGSQGHHVDQARCGVHTAICRIQS